MSLGNGVTERAGEAAEGGGILGEPHKNRMHYLGWVLFPKNPIASSRNSDKPPSHQTGLCCPGRVMIPKISNYIILGG